MKYLFAALSIFVVALFVSDQILGLAGFPSGAPLQFAHPRNFEEVRKNIEFEYTFKTNDQGLRYASIPLQKPPGEKRVLLLGDSFIEGSVQSDETIGAYLEQRNSEAPAPAVRFINGGLSGRRPLDYWRLFQNVGRGYGLDAVLICIFANDVTGMPEQLSRQDLYATTAFATDSEPRKLVHLALPRIDTLAYRIHLERRMRVQRETDFLVQITEAAIGNGKSEAEVARWASGLPGHLVDAARRKQFNSAVFSLGFLQPYFWTDALNIDTPRAERKYRSLILSIDEILAVARAERIGVGLVYLPSPLQYETRRHEPTEPWIIAGAVVERRWLTTRTEVERRLEHWAAERSVPFLDLTPAFRAHQDPARPTNWKLDEHLNAFGNQVAAAAIAHWIKTEGLLESR